MSQTKFQITRRGVLLGGVGLAGAALLNACSGPDDKSGPSSSTGGGSESSTSNSTTTTEETPTGEIVVVGNADEIDEDSIKAFEAQYPGSKVTLIPYSWDQVTTMLAAGNAPDLIRGEGVNDTPYLVYRDLAEPLDDYIAGSTALKADDLLPINDVWRHDGSKQGTGSLYGLVKDYSSDLCIWVNRDLVSEMPSLTEPMTYDQLLDLAISSTKTEAGRTAVYGFDCYLADKPHITWMNAAVASTGAQIFSDDLKTVDFTSDGAVKFIKWNLDLISANATVSTLNPSSQGPDSLYLAGRMAMFMSGFWTQGIIPEGDGDVPENSVMIPAPQLGSDRISPVISGSGLWMAKGAKNKPLAWKFMEFYFAGAPAKDRASSGWGMPALKSLQSLVPTETPLQKATLATQQGEDPYFKVMNFTPYARVDAIDSEMASVINDAVKAGGYDAAAVAKKCQDAVNAVLSAGQD